MPPSNRPPSDVTLGDVVVTSRPLPFERAEDSMPEVYLIFTRVSEMLVATLGDAGLAKFIKLADSAENLMSLLLPLLPTLRTLFEQLGEGRLKKLVPLLLFSTTAVAPNEAGVKEIHELAKAADRAKLFDLYPESYWPTVIFAGAVTYKRFFPGSVLSGFSWGKGREPNAA